MRLKTSNPRECRGALTKLCNMVVNNQISCKEASTVGYLINSILAAYRLDEVEARQAELEELLREKEKEHDNGKES